MDKQEAIKILKEFHDTSALFSVRTALETVFPELKESEDERIRKGLIRFHKSTIDVDGIKGEDIIAWLEKQGEIDKESYEINEKEKREFVGDGFIKCYADFQDFKEGETYWLEYLGNDNYNVRSDNLFGKTYHITPCQLYTVFKKQTWLEKQGEPIDDNIITRDDEILQAISIGLTDALENFGWSDFGGLPIEEIQEWLEKQGEKKPIEWKDSDEKYLFWALLSIQKDIATSEINGVNTKDLNECVKWLYSLKQRIGG